VTQQIRDGHGSVRWLEPEERIAVVGLGLDADLTLAKAGICPARPTLQPKGPSTRRGSCSSPGWTFLGATYDAVLVQAFVMQSLGAPLNVQFAGVHNTYVVPVELSWMFGNTGLGVKTGLGIFTPDGTQTGITKREYGSAVLDISAGSDRLVPEGRLESERSIL
jgi:hypothetical protein